MSEADLLIDGEIPRFDPKLLTEQAKRALPGLSQYPIQTQNPKLGDVPLFPADRNGLKPIRRDVASRWLLRAEKMAELPKLRRGVFHPYRRLWASERKALPAKDVAECGGWKDIETMLASYVQSDAATVLRVVENTG